MFLARYFLALPVALLLLLTPLAVSAASTSDEIDKVCQAAEANGDKQPSYCAPSSDATENPLTGTTGLLTKITNIIAFAAGLAAVVVIIISGARFVLSRGDSAKVVTARQAILYALVGIVVVVIARQIIVFVLSRI